MSADGAQKIAIVIKPLLDALEKNLNEKQVSISQELLIELGKLRAEVELLQLALSEKKKPIAREPKKVEAVATTAVAAVAASPVVKNFPMNKFVYFRDQYKNNAAYREKYVNAELRALLDADPTIKGKANEGQRNIAEATFCWTYWKNGNQPEVLEAANKEFDAAKIAHESNNKPPQQTVENHTPV